MFEAKVIRVAAFDNVVEPGSSIGDLDRLGRKLGRHTRLSSVEHEALARWLGRSLRIVRDGVPLVEHGASPSEINIVVDGWAARYRTAPNGRRHILAFHLPGDVCEFDAFVMRSMDSTIQAVTRLRVACITRDALDGLIAEHPMLAQALQRESQVAASIGREWTISIGHRNARQRIAHLLCELAERMRHVGLLDGDVMALPLTQAHLGDACALTPEHTNRSLRELRDAGLIALRRGELGIVDWAGLTALAHFDKSYFDQTG